jgi:hypothetical protein
MSEIKLRKAPKSVSEKGMKPVVYTLVKTKDGKYPPFYQIPAEDEIYAEWEDESGVKCLENECSIELILVALKE